MSSSVQIEKRLHIPAATEEKLTSVTERLSCMSCCTGKPSERLTSCLLYTYYKSSSRCHSKRPLMPTCHVFRQYLMFEALICLASVDEVGVRLACSIASHATRSQHARECRTKAVSERRRVCTSFRAIAAPKKRAARASKPDKRVNSTGKARTSSLLVSCDLSITARRASQLLLAVN